MSVIPADAPDFSPTGPYDSGQIDWKDTTTAAGTRTSPIMSCSAWQSSHVRQFVGSGTVQVRTLLNWYADAAGSIAIDGRGILYDSALTISLAATFINLGPFVQVTVTPSNMATVWGGSTYLLFNNRNSTVPVQAGGQQFSFGAGTIAAAGASTFTINANMAGRVAIAVSGGTQGVTASWQFLNNGFTYAEMTNYAVAANVRDYREIIMPLSTIQVVLTNQSATNPCNGVSVDGAISMGGV